MSRIDTESGMSSDIGWLRSVLWSAPEVTASLREQPLRDHRRLLTYGLVPSARRPRLLVPMGAPGARRGSFWQFNNGMSQRGRLAKAAAGIAVRLAPWAVVRDRLHIDIRRDVAEHDLPELLPESFLAALLGREQTPVSISFGSPRPNRKPVLQALTEEGVPLAYMKVAWNDLTAALVRNEAQALTTFTAAPPSTFSVPAIVSRSRWRGHEVAVTRAFPHTVRRIGSIDHRPGSEIVREVAERAGVARQALRETALWNDVRDHLRGAGPRSGVGPDLVERFEAVFGDVECVVGAWHGDWAPWNMTTTSTGLLVWDWERFRTGVPVGLDLVHFAYQVQVHRARSSQCDAAVHTLEHAPTWLGDLGVDAATWRPLLCLYLFELVGRYLGGAREGVAGAPTAQADAILAAIDHVGWSR